MGCASSKFDHVPAVVSICRHRCNFIDDALHQSYAFSTAHVAYINSLNSVGHSMHNFFQLQLGKDGAGADGKVVDAKESTGVQTLSTRSDSGSHRKDKYESEFEGNVPPPPVPSSSSWDFLNLFESYELYNFQPYPDVEWKEIQSAHEIRANGASEDRNVDKKKDEVENGAEFGNRGGTLEVVRELQVLFGRAADSGNTVLKTLHPNGENPLCQGIKIHLIDHDELVTSGNLSSTLRKLCIWEKKLYDEVKAEGKMRLMRAEKCRLIKSLDRKGANAHKVDSTQSLIRNLSTKIKVSIQVIDKISITVNKVRDEELWPHVDLLVQRFSSMWNDMLDCHKCQSRAIVEAKGFSNISCYANPTDAHVEAALQLKIELKIWIISFSNWIKTQKAYVKALNGWLSTLFHIEPDKTRSVFVEEPIVNAICNQWSESLDRLPENDVFDAMVKVIGILSIFLEKHNLEVKQKIAIDKNLETKLRTLEKDEKSLERVIRRQMKTVNESKSFCVSTTNMQMGLKEFFMAMHNFAEKSMQVYEELHKRIRECKPIKEDLREN